MVTPLPNQPTQGLDPWYAAQVAWQNGVETNISELDAQDTSHSGNSTHLPAGGAANTILAKTSATNYAVGWVSPTDLSTSPWQIFDVFDYGAVGDGTTDDSAAIQAAVDAAEASATGRACVRLGRYHAVGTEVTISSGVRVEGHGSNQTLIKAIGAATSWVFGIEQANKNGQLSPDDIDAEFSAYTPASDKSGAQISGISIFSADRTTLRNGIRVRLSTEPVLSDIRIANLLGTALLIGAVAADVTFGNGSVRNVSIENVHVTRCGQTNTPAIQVSIGTVTAADSSNFISFESLVFEYNSGGILLFCANTDNGIANIAFSNSKFFGLAEYGATYNDHDIITIEGSVNNIVFSSCFFSGSGQFGSTYWSMIRTKANGTQSPRSLVIDSCVLVTCAHFLTVDALSDLMMDLKGNYAANKVSGHLINISSGSGLTGYDVELTSASAWNNWSSKVIIPNTIKGYGSLTFNGHEKGTVRHLIQSGTTYPPRSADTDEMYIWIGTADPASASSLSTGSASFQEVVDIWIDTT